MKVNMKKSLVAAVFSCGLVGNVFASCDSTPYLAPIDMQPDCADQTPIAQEAATPTASKLKVSESTDSKNKHNADKPERPVLKQLSLSVVK